MGATFADYRHGLTERRRVPAAMTRKRSLAAVQESTKEFLNAKTQKHKYIFLGKKTR